MDFSSNTDGKRKLPSVIPSGNPPWIAGFRVFVIFLPLYSFFRSFSTLPGPFQPHPKNPYTNRKNVKYRRFRGFRIYR